MTRDTVPRESNSQHADILHRHEALVDQQKLTNKLLTVSIFGGAILAACMGYLIIVTGRVSPKDVKSEVLHNRMILERIDGAINEPPVLPE